PAACSGYHNVRGCGVTHLDSAIYCVCKMRLRPFFLFIFLFVATGGALASPPQGVPHELARRRAGEISDITYRLTFILAPHAKLVSGDEEISFTLRSQIPAVLDFREGAVSTLDVNGNGARVKAANGYIELPPDRLRVGANTVGLHFTSRIATAGETFTRYEDRDDHTEYVYTLFV